MSSPEKFPLPGSEEPEQPKEKRVRRIVARPAKEVLSGKQKIIPYPESEVFEPPIAMPIYEEFDAAKSFADLKEEIGAMQDLPPGVRRGRIRARLGEIREHLVWQEKGIAEAIGAVWSAIEKNPDENDRELFARVAELAPTHHFSNDELREFWTAIVDYRIKHAVVERARASVPKDEELFEACFDRKPEGKVEVKKGPMSLYFHCYDDNDYVAAFNVPETGGDGKKLTSAMEARALATRGARIPKTKIEALDGIVAIGRTSTETYRWEHDERARVHEEQHIVNKLFIPVATRMNEAKIIARIARTAENVDEGRRMLMQELARSARKTMGIDNEARDEILAHYKGGIAPEKILENLTKLSMYDYRNSELHKEEVAGLPKAIAGKMMNEMSAALYAVDAQGKEHVRAAGPLVTDYTEVEPYVEKVFGDDYKKDVARWVGAIGTLEHKGYARDDIVSMLYGERVSDWQAFARRAPEKKV